MKEHQRYQPEIDGLRAIAVLSVIIFHLNEKWLPGGFIGVDIFFVISGYLITSNLYPQIQNNTFSFLQFYNKRIKRLLPSLYLILLICTIVSSFLFLKDDYYLFNKSLKKIVFFWSNHYFASGRDYFSPLSNENPLLHTWSLAVEEQFYFIWPIIIYALSKLNYSKKKIIKTALAFSIISFLISSALIFYNFKLWAYYSFPSRYGELLIGGILAIFNKKITKFSSIAYCFAFIFIFPGMFLINEKSPFPGFLSLVPCLGASLILISSSNKLSFLLSNRPFVTIGKLSYQLYLWHWPILAFIRYASGKYELTKIQIFCAISLTVVISFVVYTLLENRIRYLNSSFKKTFIFIYLIPTILILSLGLILKKQVFKTEIFSDNIYSHYGDNICHGQILNGCLQGDKTNPKFFLFGDSHAAHLNLFINHIGNHQHWGSLVVSSSGCLPITNLQVDDTFSLEDKSKCKLIKNFVKDNYLQYKFIGLAGRWDQQLKNESFLPALEKELEFLTQNKKIVFIFSQIPLKVNSPQREELLSKRLSIQKAPIFDNVSIKANQQIKKIVSKYDNVVWIDIESSMLSMNLSDNCSQPLYKDKDHLNSFGSKSLAEYMINNQKLEELKIISH